MAVREGDGESANRAAKDAAVARAKEKLEASGYVVTELPPAATAGFGPSIQMFPRGKPLIDKTWNLPLIWAIIVTLGGVAGWGFKTTLETQARMLTIERDIQEIRLQTERVNQEARERSDRYAQETRDRALKYVPDIEASKAAIAALKLANEAQDERTKAIVESVREVRQYNAGAMLKLDRIGEDVAVIKARVGLDRRTENQANGERRAQ